MQDPRARNLRGGPVGMRSVPAPDALPAPLLPRHHVRPEVHLRPQLEYIPVVHPDAPVTRLRADDPWLVRAVDAVAGEHVPVVTGRTHPAEHAHLPGSVDPLRIRLVLGEDLPHADRGP